MPTLYPAAVRVNAFSYAAFCVPWCRSAMPFWLCGLRATTRQTSWWVQGVCSHHSALPLCNMKYGPLY